MIRPLEQVPYFFTREAGVWSQQAYLKASNTEANDRFGSSVAISEGMLVVGAQYEDSNALDLGGGEANNSARDSGAVYTFFYLIFADSFDDAL